jgi:hypothetical protein
VIPEDLVKNNKMDEPREHAGLSRRIPLRRGSIFNATPAVSNGQLLLRSDRFLYCIGE